MQKSIIKYEKAYRLRVYVLFLLGGNMKIHLFFCGRKVKTITRKEPVSNWNEVIKKNYKVTIIGHRDIFRKFIVTVYLTPTKLLSDPTDKEVNLNCELYGGANIE